MLKQRTIKSIVKTVGIGLHSGRKVELPNITMPRLNKFKNKAIVADLTAVVTRVDTRHRVGINVLYGDGSAKWMDRHLFDADLRACTAIAPSTDPGRFNTYQDHIWAALDQ